MQNDLFPLFAKWAACAGAASDFVREGSRPVRNCFKLAEVKPDAGSILEEKLAPSYNFVLKLQHANMKEIIAALPCWVRYLLIL